MKKSVYICAPLGGSPEAIRQNIENAKLYTRFALKSGVAPTTPHFLALCLDDNIPEERELGRSAAMSMLWNCQELWIFGHEITEGMQAEIDFCKTFNRKIRRIKYGEIKKLIGGKRSYEK